MTGKIQIHKPNKADWVYLAGVLDCDGCFSCNTFLDCGGSTHYCGDITIVNTNKRLTNWLLKKFHGLVISRKLENPRAKDMYRWKPLRRDIISIAEGVLPYLVLKKEQAGLLIQFRKTVSYKGNCLNPQIVKQRNRIVKRMKQLNSRGR